MDITKAYSLERLTADSVNVVVVSFADINSEQCEIGRYRMSYANSPIGRKMVEEALPEEYKKSSICSLGR